jgi:hypothetical protein
MNRLPLLFLTLVGSLLMGCASYVPFTHEVRTQHALADTDLRQLQFYLSHDITLRREVRTRGREIAGGELKLVSGKLIEEIVIPKRTPGIAVAVDSVALHISFEEGSAFRFSILDGEPIAQPLRVLPKGSGFAEPPEAFPADAREPNDPFAHLSGNYLLAGGANELSFRGQSWQLVGDSHQAHLLIDAESLDEVVERRVTLGGRRL